MYQCNNKVNDCTFSSNCSIISGNSLDVNVNKCDCEVRADIMVAEFNSVRLWGRVVNCDGKPVSNALVKLLKVVCQGDRVGYQGVAHTVSDCDGFYQFEVCNLHDGCEEPCFKVLVGKAAVGPERLIPVREGNCDPCDISCNPNAFNPCQEFPTMITPPGEKCCDGDQYTFNSYNQGSYKGKSKY